MIYLRFTGNLLTCMPDDLFCFHSASPSGAFLVARLPLRHGLRQDRMAAEQVHLSVVNRRRTGGLAVVEGEKTFEHGERS